MFKALVNLLKGQKGGVNLGGILMMGIGMVFLAVGFIFLPIANTAVTNIADYAYSGNASITASTFTGLTSINGIVPLLILIGFLAAAVITGFLGIKIMQGKGEAKLSPGSLLLLGLSIVFIAIGLIMFPISLDGVSAAYHNGGQGIGTTFVGYAPLLLMSPMLIELAYIAAAVFSGFFGIKSIATMQG